MVARTGFYSGCLSDWHGGGRGLPLWVVPPVPRRSAEGFFWWWTAITPPPRPLSYYLRLADGQMPDGVPWDTGMDALTVALVASPMLTTRTREECAAKRAASCLLFFSFF